MNVFYRRLQIATVVLCCFFFVGFCNSAKAQEARRLHVIVVADMGSGLPVHQNVDQIGRLFARVRLQYGDRIQVELMAERLTRPSDVLGRIQRVRDLDSRDALLVFYLGHGATDPNYGHYFQLSGGNLLRSHVREAILQHNPRLGLLLSDCCSMFCPLPPVAAAPSMAAPKGDAPQVDPAALIVRDLFFRHEGLVDLTAASFYPDRNFGEASWFNNKHGGIFASSLVDTISSHTPGLLDRSRDGLVSWPELMNPVAKQTQQNYVMMREGMLRSGLPLPATPKQVADFEVLRVQDRQVPQFFSVGRPATNSQQVVVAKPPRPRLGVGFIENYGFGLVIVGIAQGSPAHAAQFDVGDIVQSINGRAVRSIEEYWLVMDTIPAGSIIVVSGRNVRHSWREPFSLNVQLQD